MSRAGLAAIENLNCKLTESNKMLICFVFNVNPNWLNSGVEPIFIDLTSNEEDFLKIFKSLNDDLQTFLLKTAKNLLDLQEHLF